MGKGYISDIKSTKRTLRFMHSEYDSNEPYIIYGDDMEIIDFSRGMIWLYNGIYFECLTATEEDFENLQKGALQTTAFVTCGEKYIINLSRVKNFSYENGQIDICTKEFGWFRLELKNQEDINEFLDVLNTKFKKFNDKTI